MRRSLPLAAPVLLVAGLLPGTPATAATEPPPVPGGLIGTMVQGKYSCELPGDAGGPIRVPASDFDFAVIRGSSYRAGGVRGSYLRTGDMVTMTGGKLKGLKLHLLSDGFLRRIEANGQDGEMRCVLSTPANS